jgi:hypothetical protein
MAAYRNIDDCLSIRDSHLFVEDYDMVDLVKRYDSPLFVISENQVRRNVRGAIPRPATVLVTGDQAAIIRRRETEADVFRRDVMPEHLQRPGTTGQAVHLREPESTAE